MILRRVGRSHRKGLHSGRKTARLSYFARGSSERYFAKANTYWMRATNMERDSDEFLLNVSFACEFPARGALCFVNPALNSASDEESVLFSSGVSANRPPKTADIHIAFSRLRRLIPTITTEESETVAALTSLRNRELHGDIASMSTASQKEIMPQIYSYITKVADFAKQDLRSLLSDSDATQARQTANAIHKDRKKRVQDLIKIQKDRFYGLTKEEKEERRSASKPKFVSAVTSAGHHLRTYKCPSCAQEGLLGGTPVGRSAPILREDGIYQELRIVPEMFECKCCELQIRGLDELMAAGVEHEFRTLDEMDVLEHFQMDVMDFINMEDIIREYHADAQRW